MVDKKKSSVIKKTGDKSVISKEVEKKTTTKKSEKIKATTKVSSKKTTKKKFENHELNSENKNNVNLKNNNTSKKKISNANLWKISSTVLVIVVLFLAIVIGVRFFSGTLSNTSFEETSDSKVEDLNNPLVQENDNLTEKYSLLIIEDSTCKTCNVDYFIDQIKTNLISNLQIEKIEFSSDVGKTVSKSLGIKIAPLFLFSESISNRDDWEKLKDALIPVSIVGINYFLLNPMILESKVLIEDPIISQNAIMIGNKNAKVTLVEYGDFECTVCALMKGSPKLSQEFKIQKPDFIPTLPKIMQEYVDSGKVKYVFYNFPIDRIHKSARAAHNAGLCANEQNQFSEYSNILYKDREKWVDSNNTKNILIEFTNDLKIDKSQFTTCLNEQKYNTQIDDEIRLGLPYGVAGTPTYFINRQVLSGLTDYKTFAAVIESELNK